MSVQRVTGTIPASGIWSGGPGNFLLFVSANAAVNLRLEQTGIAERFDGISGGLYITRLKPWQEMRILGGAGVTFEYLIGDEYVDKDETDVRLQIATIAGVAAVRQQPAASGVSTAKVTLATANSIDISANLARVNMIVCNESASLGSVWVRDQTATTDAGIELQPGSSVPINGTYAFRVRNNSGANANISFHEES